MVSISRRNLLKAGVVGGASLLVPWRLTTNRATALGAPPLAPATVRQFIAPLPVPPAMPLTGRIDGNGRPISYYEIAVRQFQQQVLPPGHPRTTVWGYGSVNHAGSFSWPSPTIEAQWQAPVRVKWVNGLVDAQGRYLPHLLPVDPTLHWANPPGGNGGRDTRPMFDAVPGPYTGPVPMVAHLHGGEVTPQESDGYPEAWYLPDASNIPSGYARTGTFFDQFKDSSPLGDQWGGGSAVFEYPNDQRDAALWFHDHTLGMTRANVYAGPAGYYLLRGSPADAVDGILPGPAPALGDRPGTRHYEIPLVLQDRSFRADGSLFYPDSRAFFDGFEGPYIGDTFNGVPSDISPIWNPEFFGDTMTVNGRTWPFLNVERRRYRFRILNGSDSRFLILQLTGGLPFWQIGSDGGFLREPVELQRLLLAPAERADVIVDFGGVRAGTRIVLENVGPDEPFGGGEPGVDFDPADPATTGRVMQFRVVGARAVDPSTPPDQLGLPAFADIAAGTVRQVSLNEEDSQVVTDDDGELVGPRAALLGMMHGDEPMPMEWMHEATETPQLGSTEQWEINNFTMDAHPIHLHATQFRVVERVDHEGNTREAEPWETGFKDTVIAYPHETTVLRARFFVRGRYVWHCHILSHEDNEMMRPLVVE